jgi:protein-L-isoaspartate O-methyltransferase
MRNVFMVLAMMLWSIGCGSGYKVMVVPLNEMDTMTSKAVILAVAEQPKKDVEVEPDVTGCKCGGTGRSGDGLGPCACPDGCKCKPNRAEAPVEVEEKPVVEEVVPDPVDPVEPEQPEATSDFHEIDLALEDAVTRLTDLSEKLVDNQVGFATKLEEFEARLKAIEQPAVKQEADAVEASPSKAIVNQLFVFTKMDGTCPPCTTFDENEVPKLIDAGWSVGKDETYNVVLCDVTGDMSEVVQLRYEQFRKYGTPYFAYFKAGAFVKGYAGYTSAGKIAEDFNAVINQQVSSSAVQQHVPNVLERLPVMQTQWGTIDMETYKRNCNCPMCEGIRAIQSQLRQSQVQSQVQPVAPHQEPTPDPVISRMLDEMSLTSGDVLADLGCGDGRVLIAAHRKFRCRCVGVEIDPVKAGQARRLVSNAGLTGQIQIITGDARLFQPEQHGVTAITAYLYPELLQQLVPVFKRAKVVATPYHRVSGLTMVSKGDVWLYDTRKATRLHQSSRMTVPTFGLFKQGKNKLSVFGSNSL